MSKKRYTALFLSIAMLSSTLLSTSAQEATQSPFALITDVRAASIQTNVNQAAYKTMLPDQYDLNIVSVSYNEYAFSAHRLNNGDVEITIDERKNNIRGHYEFLATDAAGELFKPENNAAYNITATGLYKVIMPSNTVSKDGYVYMNASLLPGSNLISTKQYKIPVDYVRNKVKTDVYTDLTNQPAQISLSATFANFEATAYKMDNGDIEVAILIRNMNAYSIKFEHLATSLDGGIYLRQRNSTVSINCPPNFNNQVTFITLPANSVSSSGYVYFNIYLDVPIYGERLITDAKLKIPGTV